ncbi:uncharacterized protein [Palaemon carinicauda]
MRKVSCSSNWKNFKRVVIVSDGRIEFDKDIMEMKSQYEIQVFNKSQLVLDDLVNFTKEKIDFSVPIETLMICCVGSYDLISLEDDETCQYLSNHKPFKQISLKNPNDKDILGKLIKKTKEQKKKLQKLLGSESDVYFTTIDYVKLVKFHENQLKLHDRKSIHELALRFDKEVLMEMESRLDRVIKSYNKYNLENNLTALPLEIKAYLKKPVGNGKSHLSSSEVGLVLSSDMCLEISRSFVTDIKIFLKKRSRYKKVVFVGDSRLEHVRKAWPSDIRYNCKIITDNDLTLSNLSNAEDPIMKEICSSEDSLIVISPGVKDLCKLVSNPECKNHKKLEIFVPYFTGSKMKNPNRIINKMIELSVYMCRILKHIDKLTLNCDVLFTDMYDFDLLSYQEYVTLLHHKEENHNIKTPIIDIKEDYPGKLKDILSIIQFYNVICQSISHRYSFKLRSFPTWIPGKAVGEGNAQVIAKSVLYDGVHPSSSVAAEMAERFKLFADEALKLGTVNCRSPNVNVLACIIAEASAKFIIEKVDNIGYTSKEYRKEDKHGENEQTANDRRGTHGSKSFSGSSHISKRRHPEQRSSSTKVSESQCISNLLDHPLSDVSDKETFYDSENSESSVRDSVRENHGRYIQHLKSAGGTKRKNFKHKNFGKSLPYHKGHKQTSPVLHDKRFSLSFSTGGRSSTSSLSPPPSSRYYVRGVSYPAHENHSRGASYPAQENHSRAYDLASRCKNSKMSGKGIYSRSPSVSEKFYPRASHSRSPSPREKSPETIALMSLRDVHNKECEVYRKQPNAHPDYDKEFRMYRDKKFKCIIEIGGDPITYDIKKDWEEFWKTRLEQLLEFTWTSRRDKCLEMLHQSKTSKSNFPMSTEQQPKKLRRKIYKSRSRSSSRERKSRNLERKIYKSRSRSSSRERKSRNLERKIYKSRSRSSSRERKSRNLERKIYKSRSRSSSRDRHSRSLEFTTKRKMNRSVSRSYSPEREVYKPKNFVKQKKHKTRSRSVSWENESRSFSRERDIQKEKEFIKKRKRKRSRSNSSSVGSDEHSGEEEEQKWKISKRRSSSIRNERASQKQKDLVTKHKRKLSRRSSSEESESQLEDKREFSVKLTRDISKRASARERKIGQKGLSISSSINRSDNDHSFESDESTECRKDKKKCLPEASSLLNRHSQNGAETNQDMSEINYNIKDEEFRRLQSLLNNEQVQNLFKQNREASLDVLRNCSLSDFLEKEFSKESKTCEKSNDGEMAGESIVSKPENIAKDSSELSFYSSNRNESSLGNFSEGEFIKKLKTFKEGSDNEMAGKSIVSKPKNIANDSSELLFHFKNRNNATSSEQHLLKAYPFQDQKTVFLPETLEKIRAGSSSTKSDILTLRASSSGRSVLPYASEGESADEVTSTTPSFGPDMLEDVIEVLEILVRLGDRLGVLKNPLKSIYEKALLYKSMGFESSKLLSEKDSKTLLSFISNKLNKLVEEEDLSVIQRVIIQEASERLHNILKASGPDLEISLIAEKCLGRNDADTFAYIQSQFFENGMHLASQERLKAVYVNVQSEKSKLLNNILKQSTNTPINSPSSKIKNLHTQSKEMSFEYELSAQLPFQHSWSSEDSQVSRCIGNRSSLLGDSVNKETITDISSRREFEDSRQKVKENPAEAESYKFSSQRTSIDFPAERRRNSESLVTDGGFTSEEYEEFSTNKEQDIPSNRRYKDSPEREFGKYSSEGFMNNMLSGKWFKELSSKVEAKVFPSKKY